MNTLELIRQDAQTLYKQTCRDLSGVAQFVNKVHGVEYSEPDIQRMINGKDPVEVEKARQAEKERRRQAARRQSEDYRLYYRVRVLPIQLKKAREKLARLEREAADLRMFDLI